MFRRQVADDSDIYEELGANICGVISAVARRTEHDDLSTAATRLHADLSQAGIRADDSWCRGVLERLRRGDQVTIDLD